MGTPKECFLRGFSVGYHLPAGFPKTTAQNLQDVDPITNIRGIGVRLRDRIAEDYDINTVGELVDYFLAMPTDDQRRTELIFMLRNFSNAHVNRRAYAFVRQLLNTRGMDIANVDNPFVIP